MGAPRSRGKTPRWPTTRKVLEGVPAEARMRFTWSLSESVPQAYWQVEEGEFVSGTRAKGGRPMKSIEHVAMHHRA
jgi:hypothetical protein